MKTCIYIHPTPDALGYERVCWDYLKEVKFFPFKYKLRDNPSFKMTYPYKVKFHTSLTKQEAVKWCYEDKDIWIYCIENEN